MAARLLCGRQQPSQRGYGGSRGPGHPTTNLLWVLRAHQLGLQRPSGATPNQGGHFPADNKRRSGFVAALAREALVRQSAFAFSDGYSKRPRDRNRVGRRGYAVGCGQVRSSVTRCPVLDQVTTVEDSLYK